MGKCDPVWARFRSNLDAFWTWFEEKEEWIINCSTSDDSAFVWKIDEKLKPVFPYFKGVLVEVLRERQFERKLEVYAELYIENTDEVRK